MVGSTEHKHYKVDVQDYVDIDKRAAELQCNVPTGLTILPRNFATAATKKELLHEDTTPTVRALLSERDLVETRLEQDGERFSYIEENSFEWVGPIVLFGSAVFSQNPSVISVTLNVISNYLTDFFKGRTGNKNVKFTIVVPQPHSRKYMRINYEGSVDGIKQLESIIKETRRGARRR